MSSVIPGSNDENRSEAEPFKRFGLEAEVTGLPATEPPDTGGSGER